MSLSFAYGNAGYVALDGQTVFVRGQDGNLWFTPAPFGQVPNPNRVLVDSNIIGFVPMNAGVDIPVVYVLGSDRILWSTPGPFFGGEPVPNPNRVELDSLVLNYQALDAQTVFVLRADRTLWYNPQDGIQGQVDGNVLYFQALSDQDVFVLGTDGKLWYTPGPFLPKRPIPNPNRVLIDSNMYARFPGFSKRCLHAQNR